MKIRIHHFFDIIRDFGIGKEITPHPYLHSYHKIADMILNDPDINFEIVVGTDAICDNCVKLNRDSCDDVITHRKDFFRKEDFNNYLDKQILEICKINMVEVYTPKQLCKLATRYLENIETIYLGNETWHTEKRKENVIKGLNFYSQKHNLNLTF